MLFIIVFFCTRWTVNEWKFLRTHTIPTCVFGCCCCCWYIFPTMTLLLRDYTPFSAEFVLCVDWVVRMTHWKEAHSHLTAQLNWHRVLHTCNPISIWWNHSLPIKIKHSWLSVLFFITFCFVLFRFFYVGFSRCDSLFSLPLIKSLTSPNSQCTSRLRLYLIFVRHLNSIRKFWKIHG